MAFPAHGQWQENDPERTDLIPRFGGQQAETPPWQAGAPGRPPGGPPPDGGLPEYEILDFDPELHQRARKKRKRPLWRELVTLLGVALLLTFLIQAFLGRFYLIPSGSMEKTLHGCPGCNNDRVLVDKLTYAFTDPEPGDVVVFEGPDTWDDDENQTASSGNVFAKTLQGIGAVIGLAPPDENDFVKRVVAVGGQTVQCCDPKGRVLVDGRPLTEPYVYWKGGKPNGRQRFDPVVVPQGALWVMGDNRNNSKDSRLQGGGGLRGVVPVDHVIGKARYIVLPPSRWSGVGDHDPQGAAVALGAPAWQEGVPAGVGLLAAWPTLWLGRRARRLIRLPWREDQDDDEDDSGDDKDD